jgi:UPF0755 protein
VTRLRGLVLQLATIAILSAAAVTVASLWFGNAVYGDRARPLVETTVVVPRGSTTAQVARLLAERGIIRSAFVLQLLARLRHDDARIEAGEFRFAPGESVDEVLRHLLGGGAQVAVWVTFPEGFTMRQIAQTLADHGLGSAEGYERTFATSSIIVDGTRTKSLEGFLFPSTYLIPTNATPSSVARILTDQFRAELPRDAAGRAHALGISVVDAVTLASLIEREAQANDERPLMAGVYYNRLRRGMPLEVDATIEYTFPEHKTEITRADLASDSPYNTYRHVGLPPTPIANPGLPSLRAALNPQASSYLYYVYKGNGHHAFARTLAEHNANVARYLR